MAKRHKKHHHEEHVDETWLIPYADVLTLLLALFIVMFAASQVDQAKMKAVSEVFHEMFDGGTGLLEGNPSTEKNSSPPTQSSGTAQQSAAVKTAQQEAQMEQLKEQFQKEIENLQKLQQELEKYIQEKQLSDKLKTELSTKGLMVTIQDGVFFESGSAQVKAEGIPIAQELANIFNSDGTRDIEISGHTDNIPISNERFRSNWELSTARAIDFLQVLLRSPGLDPARFSASGYAEFKPIASNDTEEGRQQNRRVEVLILPNIETKQATWDEVVKTYKKKEAKS